MTSAHGSKYQRELIARVRRVAELGGARIIEIEKTGRGHTAFTLALDGGQGPGRAIQKRRRIVVAASGDWRAIHNTATAIRAVIRSMTGATP